MSDLTLQIHVSSKLPISNIAEYLSVPKKEVNGVLSYEVECGPVWMYFNDPWWDSQELGNKTPWNLAITLTCVPHWNNLRMLLALEICRLLHSEAGGYFFAAYDTGDPLFSIGNDGVFFSSDYRNYYSVYPLPLQRYSFRKLPTI